MNQISKIITAVLVAASNFFIAGAQNVTPETTDIVEEVTLFDEVPSQDSIVVIGQRGDTLTVRAVKGVAVGVYREPVFDGWHRLDSLSLTRKERDPLFASSFQWLDDLEQGYLIVNRARLNYIVNNPDKVVYNEAFLPKRPEDYNVVVDAVAERVEIPDMAVSANTGEVSGMVSVNKLKWLRTFNGLVQFTQAYISPNWYQGGNSSLTMLVNALYNVKLNQNLYPNILFETTVSYKLALNTVPEDTVHNYNVSEDLFQVSSTFGYKAAKKWYYTVNLLFKTQFLNSYKANSLTLQSAFLSPAELNIGAGMTYNYTNKKGNFSIKASIDPISWQLKASVNRKVDQTRFDIPEGRRWTNKSGSSAGYNMTWNMAYNIAYTSTLFMFTDYRLFQADWEHKLVFTVNKFLTTNINVNMRYDTETPRIEGSKWRKFQLKEILSFGFSYTLSNSTPK